MSLTQLGAIVVRAPDVTQRPLMTAALGQAVYDPGGLTPFTVDLPSGSSATVSQIDQYGNTYFTDGTILTAGGNHIDPYAPGGATVTYTDVFGNVHTDQAPPIITDPATGLPVSSGDWLKMAGGILDLANKAKQLITGQGPVMPAQGPVYVGGGQWRLPNGQMVSGQQQPNGLYRLSTGQMVPAPASGFGGVALLGLLGLGAFMFFSFAAGNNPWPSPNSRTS